MSATDGTDLHADVRVVAHAHIGRETLDGVAIPREAVVRFAGKTWAYVAREDDGEAIERRAVSIATPAAGGWLNREGWRAAEHAVVSGAVVTLVFRDGSDIHRLRQMVGERIAVLAPQFPRGVGPPAMTPLASSASTVLGLGVTSEKRTLMELRTLDSRPEQRCASPV